jgi:hypothetical protein
MAEARESTRFFGRELFPPTGFPPESMRDYRLAEGLSDTGFLRRAVSAKLDGSLLSVEFNLNWPLKDLMQYAMRVIRLAHRSHRDELQERGLKPPKGRRVFTDFDVHLTVWDLKQAGKSVPMIAELMFPDESTGYARQRVREHLEAAERLINGHFKEIK